MDDQEHEALRDRLFDHLPVVPALHKHEAMMQKLTAGFGSAALFAADRHETLMRKLTPGLFGASMSFALPKREAQLLGLTAGLVDAARATVSKLTMPGLDVAGMYKQATWLRSADFSTGIAAALQLRPVATWSEPPAMHFEHARSLLDKHLSVFDAGVRLSHIPFELLPARVMRDTMPLSAAFRFAGKLMPESSLNVVATALDRAQTKPLGLAALALGASDAMLAQLSSQTLAALAALELPDETDAAASNDFVRVIAAVDAALQAQTAELTELLRTLSSGMMKASGWSRGDVIALLSVLASLVTIAQSQYTIIKGQEQVQTAQAAEQRQQAEAQAAEWRRSADEALAHEQAERLQAVLEQLTEVQRELLEKMADPRREQNQVSLEPEGALPRFSVVARAVAVREGRSTTSRRIGVLNPGDVVVVHTGNVGNQKWLLIMWTGIDGDAITGWVLKKYLRPVN